MAFIYDLSDTWSAGGTTFNAIRMNVTDTASAAASRLVTLQVGGVERFGVRKDGQGYFAGNVGIGTTSPASPLEVNGIANATTVIGGLGLSVSGFNYPMRSHATADSGFGATQVANTTSAPNIRVGHGRGTYASPSALLVNDELGVLDFRGYDGATWRRGAAVFSSVDSAYSAGSMPGNLVFQAGNTERMRITSAGAVLIGTTAEPSATVAGAAFIPESSGRRTLYTATSSTTTSALLRFYNPNGQVGTITVGGTVTTYNTSSDRRLKHDIVDAPDAADLIDAIKVRSFKWNADNSEQRYGMIAQELLEVAPEAVSAPENPEEMMGVDYSKLVPMMLKEIQALRARVAQLEGN